MFNNRDKSNRGPGRKRESALSESLWKKHVQMFDDVVREHGNSNGVLVDGGCGRERFLQRYGDSFRYCIGLDIELSGNLHNSENVFYGYGHLEHIPLKDNSVDVFLTNFVLEHIRHPERFFDEIGRVIKPNGVFALWTPNAHSPFGALLKILPSRAAKALKRLFFKDFDFYKTYYRANTVSRLNRMLKKAGFVQVNVEMIDSVFSYTNSRAVLWLHNLFVRLSGHGRLKYTKNIIFGVYIKPEGIFSQVHWENYTFHQHGGVKHEGFSTECM